MTVKDTLISASSRVSSRYIHRLPARVQVIAGGGAPVTIDGNTLDPALQMLLAGQRSAGLHTMCVIGDPAATRMRAREVCRLFGGPLHDVPTTDFDLPGPHGPIPVRLYRAPDPDATLLVYFHGGGYVFGDLDTHDPLCRRICDEVGVHVLAVDYRLAPEHPAPAAVDDAYAAYLWAVANSEALGMAAPRVAVGGDSAGAALSVAVSLSARDAGAVAPMLQFLMYPYLTVDVPTRSRTLFADGFLLTRADLDWFESQYIRGSAVAADNPRVSPLLADDLSGLPRALVVTAGFDPLRDEGRAYVAKLAAAGTSAELLELGSMTHSFPNFVALGGGVADATSKTVAALATALGSSGRNSATVR